MIYSTSMEGGRNLEVENDRDSTRVGLSSASSGQQQHQSRSFTTGEWTKPPALFRSEGKFVLQLTTGQGARFLSIRGDQIESLAGQPEVAAAEQVPLREGSAAPKMEPMEPMKPMKPMRPM